MNQTLIFKELETNDGKRKENYKKIEKINKISRKFNDSTKSVF